MREDVIGRANVATPELDCYYALGLYREETYSDDENCH